MTKPRPFRFPDLGDHPCYLMTEIKLILTNLPIAGCAISRKIVISVGNGVLACKCPEGLAINGGIKWARNLLKSMKKRHNRETSHESFFI